MAAALARLRIIGVLEGASFLLLLGVAMPLKYAFDMPLAVRVVGMAHGVLFLLYLVLSLRAMSERFLSLSLWLQLVVASLLPFGPFVIDRKLKTLQQAG